MITSEEALIVTLQSKDKIGTHQASNFHFRYKIRNSRRKDELQYNISERHSLMQCVLILMMPHKDAIVMPLRGEIVMPHRARTGIWASQGQNSWEGNSWEFTFPRKASPCINNPSWINNDVNESITRRQRAYDTKNMSITDETSAKYFTARRVVKKPWSKPDGTRKSMLQDNVKSTLNASSLK